MNALLAIIFALTVTADLHEPAVLYQHDGSLPPNAQIISNFYAKKDVAVKLTAKGDGYGDLDCYLLTHDDKRSGWVIASIDESNMDQCSLSYTPTLARPMRLWVVNHGVHPTTYTVHVEQ